MNSRTAQRSACFRNWIPRPRFLWDPGIKPGKSATVETRDVMKWHTETQLHYTEILISVILKQKIINILAKYAPQKESENKNTALFKSVHLS